MNSISYFEIHVNDPQKAIAFYSTVFGWKFTQDKSLPLEYYRIKTNGMHGGLLQRPTTSLPAEGAPNAFTCSIEVANFDETAELIHDNGGLNSITKVCCSWQMLAGLFY